MTTYGAVQEDLMFLLVRCKWWCILIDIKRQHLAVYNIQIVINWVITIHSKVVHEGLFRREKTEIVSSMLLQWKSTLM